MSEPIDPRLFEFATPRQREFLEALQNHETATKAAASLGLKSPSNLTDAVRTLKTRAARAGYAPGNFENGVAPGYAMGKVTVQRGAEGNVERTWERQSPDAIAQRAAIEAWTAALAEDLPRVEPMRPPVFLTDDKLCNLFTITDAHVGMLAWHREGGEDWDLRIAENTLVGAFAHMIRSARHVSHRLSGTRRGTRAQDWHWRWRRQRGHLRRESARRQHQRQRER